MEELDYLITYNIFDETNTFQNFGFNKPWKQEPQRASSYVPTMEEISTCRASDSLPLLVGGGYEAAPLYPSNFSPAKQSAEPWGFGQPLLSEEGCYRDKTTDVDATVEPDPVLRALSFMDESSNQSVISTYSDSGIHNGPDGLLDRMYEDLHVNLQSPDGGYVSGTPRTREGGFWMDDAQLYSPTVDFSIPPTTTDYTSNSMPTPASPDAPYPAFHGMAEFTTMPQPQIDGYNFPIISPKPSVPYPPPQPITDDKCSLRRKKNNEASKISRDKRRKKVKGLEVREAELVAENQSLRSVVQELETEIAVIREKLLQKLIRPQA